MFMLYRTARILRAQAHERAGSARSGRIWAGLEARGPM